MKFLLGLLFGAGLTYLGMTQLLGIQPPEWWPQLPARPALADTAQAAQPAPTGAAAQARPSLSAEPVRTQQPVSGDDQKERMVEEKATAPAIEPPIEVAAILTTPKPEAQPALPPAAPAGGRQAVWTPFHSEASAKGFANRLTTMVGHPFDVERLAVSTYVVTFDYSSESQRSELEGRVAALTGDPS